jgi:PAS domain S-box-containing protein
LAKEKLVPASSASTPPRAILRIVQPTGVESVVQFSTLPVRFGRGPENQVILEDQNVSRIHAELRYADGHLFLRDCQSINGTRLNGELVNEAAVSPGDQITIGDCELYLLRDDQDKSGLQSTSDELIIRPEGTSGVLEIIRAIDFDRKAPRASGLDDLLSFNFAIESDEVRERFQKLTQAYNNLLVIMNLVSSVGNYSHTEQVCEQFVTALKSVFPLVENVAVFELVGEKGTELKVLHRQGFGTGFDAPTHPSKTVLHRVIEEMRAVYAVDARRDPRFTKSDSVMTRGVRSMMCAPLIARGEVNGAIYVENLTQPYCFGLFDLNFLSIFAFHLGIAVETSRLLAERDLAFERAAGAIKAVRQDKTALLLQYSQSEKKFRALFEQSALGAAVINLITGKIEEVNDGLVKMLGFSRRQFALIQYEQLLSPEDKPKAGEWLRHIRQHGEGNFKAHLLTSTQDKLVAQQSCRALRVGDTMVMLAYFIDITAKERAEEETRLQLKRVTALSEVSEALMGTMDQDAIFRLVFDKVCNVLLIDRFQVAMLDADQQTLEVTFSASRTSSHVYTFEMQPRRVPGINNLITRVLQSREPLLHQQTQDASQRARTGELYGNPFDHPRALCMNTSLFVPLASRGKIIGVVCAESLRNDAYDGSHVETLRALVAQAALALSNARAFQSIREQQEDLRSLSLQIMSAQEGERGRISRELHDGVGQQLTAMKYMLESIRTAAKAGEQERLLGQIGEASELAMQIIDDLRAISLDLRPTMLDDLGLKPTLEWFVRQYTKRYDTAVEIRCEIANENLPAAVSTTVFRIVQEALGNVAKHAQAKRVSVSVRDIGETLKIQVEDDGVGFNATKLSQKQALQGCSGILNMKERAHFLGGEFRVDTATGKGTRLFITIPIKEND